MRFERKLVVVDDADIGYDDAAVDIVVAERQTDDKKNRRLRSDGIHWLLLLVEGNIVGEIDDDDFVDYRRIEKRRKLNARLRSNNRL